MRLFAFVLAAFALSAGAQAPTCTGLCLQQTTCSSANVTTTISGVVYAPNDKDPLPNVQVFVPNAAVPAFTPGVSCPAPGTPPGGSPLVGTTTAVDGSFTILNAPVGTNIPLVIQTGRWRRQFVVSTVNSCVDNPQGKLDMPSNQSQGDIPKFAISTGNSDQVECVLRKVGIADAEFTDPSGSGRINLFTSDGSPGAIRDAATPSITQAMGTLSTLEGYDVLMLPCEGGAYKKPQAQLANLVSFANAGGRVYSSHFSYDWIQGNGSFDGVANWVTNQNIQPDTGVATIDQTFSGGQTLAQWLQLVGASTTLGQMPISTLRKNISGVIAPTQSYMTLNNAAYGNPVMQFVFDTPVGATTNQCGRVLFDEYHVEDPPTSPAGIIFPKECPPSGTKLTQQEQLLEYSLFELTSDGAAATLTPTTQSFGSEPLGFSTGAQTFTWTNNSTFASGVNLLQVTGDFSITGNNCTTVPSGKSCQVTVVFTPTALGARTGVLTVGSPGSTLTAQLTGTGVPALTVSASSAAFGNVDVGAAVSQAAVAVLNQAPTALPLPSLSFSGSGAGSYSVSNGCGGVVPSGGTCALTVVFSPTTTGAMPATLTVNASGSPQTVAVTGTGVDFSIADSPTSGSVISGYGTGFSATTTPIAGFNAPLSLSCSTTMPASTCSLSSTSLVSSSPSTVNATITTTSQYTVVGYSGGFGTGWLALLAAGSAGMLLLRRRAVVRLALAAVVLAAGAAAMTGCSSVIPARNAVYTPAGSYTLTVTATDGFLVHSATYTLKVTTH